MFFGSPGGIERKIERKRELRKRELRNNKEAPRNASAEPTDWPRYS
jgi:hypothetical protein